MRMDLQLFAYSANPTQTAANKFNEFGGASTVLARKKAKAAGEPSNWRNYMKTPKPSEIRAPWTPTPATVTPTPRASSNVPKPNPLFSASELENIASLNQRDKEYQQQFTGTPPPMASGGSSSRPSSSGVPAPMSPSNGPGAGQGSSYQPNSPGLPSRGNVPPVRDQAMIDAYIKQQTGSKLTAAELAANQARTSAQTTANQSTATLENQLAQAVARLQSARQQASEGVQTGYDRAQALTKDNRVLQDGSFQRQANPFSGSTDYKSAMIGREREISDRQQSEDLNSRLGSINQDAMNQQGAVEQDINTSKTAIQQNLTALETKITENLQALKNATPAEEARLRMDLENNERQYAAALRGEERQDVLTQAQLAQQEWQRGMEEFRTNYGIQKDERDYDYQVGRDVRSDFNADQSQAYQRQVDDRNFNYQTGRDQTKDQQYQDALREQQRQGNISLAQWGVEQFGYGDPKADAGTFFEQYAGVPTQTAQKLAQDASQMGFENAIKKALAENTISDSQAQRVVEQAQLRIQQQNANTSAASAANSAGNAAANLQLNRDKFEYEKNQAPKPNEGNLSQLTDTLNQTFGSFDQYSGKMTGIDSSKSAQLRQAIINMNLPDYQTDQLLASYGLPTN